MEKSNMTPLQDDNQSFARQLQRILVVPEEQDLKEVPVDKLREMIAQVDALVNEYKSQKMDGSLIDNIDHFMDSLRPADWKQIKKEDLVAYLQNLLQFAENTQQAMSRGGAGRRNPTNPAALNQELNNIDFYKLIGGPLQAVVQAQAASSIATVDFIKEVGFDRNADGTITGLKMADFSYTKSSTGGSADGDDSEGNTVEIKVPFIAMLNIPSLRIENVEINFNAKLNSVETSEVKTTAGVNFEAGGKLGPVSLKVTASYQRSSTSGVKVEKEYSLGVKVKATQDELPAGLEKVLNLLSAG